MNSAQEQVFDALVQSVCESRSDLHTLALDCMGVLILAAMAALGLIWFYIRGSGLLNGMSPTSLADRKILQEWMGQ
jgi:hypothetical protein